MSGVNAIDSSTPARLYAAEFIRSTFDRREAIQLQNEPTTPLALRAARRTLQSRQNIIDALNAGQTNRQTTLANVDTALTSIQTNLTSIQSLIDDTISTPGNAATNQAAIDTLVSEINTTIRGVQELFPSASFSFDGVTQNLIAFSIDSVNTATFSDNVSLSINVTQDLTRAEITDFVNGLDSSDGPLFVTITGVDGTDTVDLSATQAFVGNVITAANLSAYRTLNVGDVTLDITGSAGTQQVVVDGGTGGSVAGAVTAASLASYSSLNTGDVVVDIDGVLGSAQITIDGGTQASLADVITAASLAAYQNQNTGDVVADITGVLGTAQITIDKGTRARQNDVITAASYSSYAALNTGDVTIDITGVLGTAQITINGGTQASQADVITAATLASYQSLNTGSVSIDVVGALGTQTIAVDQGTSATANDVISAASYSAYASDNTGDVVVDITGALGTSQITINGGSVADTGAIITTSGGGGATVDFDIDFNGTTFNTTFVGGTANATVIASINADINTAGLSADIEAYATSASTIGIRSFNNGTGNTITITENSDGNGRLNAAGPYSGSAGDSLNDIRDAINAVQATTGVTASVSGGIDLVSNDGTDTYYGTSASVQVANNGGDPDNLLVDETASSGTAGDTITDIINSINAQQASTGVTASNVGGDIDLVSNDGTDDYFGTSATVQLVNNGGDPDGLLNNETAASGTSGDTLSDIRAAITAEQANTGVTAFENGGDIDIISTDGTDSYYGSGVTVQIVNNGGDPDNLIVDETQATGTAGDSLTDIVNAINAEQANTGVTADGSTGDLDLVSNDGTDSYYGSTATVQLANNGGDPENLIVDESASTGTATAETITTIINAINAEQTNTGVTATNNGGDIDISASNGTDNYQGTSADVQISRNSGGTNLLADESVGGGTAGDALADIVTNIDAVTGSTNVDAINDGSNLDLQSTDYGNSATVTVATSLGDPDGLVTDGTDTGTTVSQATAITRINAVSGTTGVEGIAGTDSDDVTLRSFQYGDDIYITTSAITNDANSTLGTAQTDYGTDGAGTLSVDGGNAFTITADRGDFTINESGLIGSFSIPVDTTFSANVTISGSSGDLTSTTTRTGETPYQRLNLNSLDLGYLGSSVTITSLGVVSRNNGLGDIDVTSDTSNAESIIDTALATITQDISSFETIYDELTRRVVTNLTAESSAIGTEITNLTTLESAITSAETTQAAADQESSETVISQLQNLFPSAVLLIGA